MAVMACVAQAGYHSISNYQWYEGENILQSETHPILYVQACGAYYKCVVDVKDKGVSFQLKVCALLLAKQNYF